MFFIFAGAYFSPTASIAHEFTKENGMHFHFVTEKQVMKKGQELTVQNTRRTLKHTMLLSKVLIGIYTDGYKEDFFPPMKKETDGYYRFDSTVDCEDKPKTYCIFSNKQIYPEYIIRYESETPD